jgi:hypothetical protein
MPSLDKVVSELPIRKIYIQQATYLLASWILHEHNANLTRTELKKIGMSSADISTMMDSIKHNHDIYIWKLNTLAKMQRRRKTEIVKYKRPIHPPIIAQTLDYKDAEKVLEKALSDVNPVINSLYRHKLRFVEVLLHGCPKTQLFERAVLTFRWEYPFSRCPGAALNSALSNYSNNIIRDATAQRRMPFTGVKSEGTFDSIVVGVEYLEQLPDTEPVYHDVNIDMPNLPQFGKTIAAEILDRSNIDPETLVDDLARQFRIETAKIREVFAYLHSYVKGEGLQRDVFASGMLTEAVPLHC